MIKLSVVVSITITFSKIVAVLIFIGAFIMDYSNDKGGTVFMYSLPFIALLITGKQFLDTKKTKPNE